MFFKITLCSLLGLLTSPTLLAEDWPQFRGPRADGTSVEKVWSPALEALAKSKGKELAPKKLWSAKLHTGYTSISIAGNRAYAMGNDGKEDILFCLDAKSGKEIWKKTYKAELKPNLYKGGPNATPAVSAKVVVTFNRSGDAYAFDAAKGKELWKVSLAEKLELKEPGWGYSASPLILGKVVYFNVGEAGAALSLSDGKILWKSGREASGYASPVATKLGEDSRMLIFNGKRLTLIDPADGKVFDQYNWKTSHNVNAALPLVMGGNIFISSGYNQGCAMLAVKEGKFVETWRNRNMNNHFNSCIHVDGFLYGFDGNTGSDAFRCIDVATGEVRWTQSGLGTGSLVHAGGHLLVLSEKGELVVVRPTPEAFTPTYRLQILNGQCWTSPALCDGRLYARTAEGELVCYDFNHLAKKG